MRKIEVGTKKTKLEKERWKNERKKENRNERKKARKMEMNKERKKQRWRERIRRIRVTDEERVKE